MINKSKPNYFLIVVFVFISMLMAHLAIIPTNIMEARNIISAREMVTEDHWIFTTLNDLPRYEKPPLPTWITALFGKIFGFEDFFYMRLPVVLITGLLSFFVYKLLKLLKLNVEYIFQTILILLTSFYIFFAGRDNNWDMYTHAFMIGGIYFLFRQFSIQKIDYFSIIISALFLAASIMSKGPVSLYALFLPFLIAYFFVFRENWKRNLIYTSIVLFVGCILGFIWMWYVKANDPETFLRVANKEVNNWHSYNTRPIYYYWSFFTQSGIWTIAAFISLFYPYFKHKVAYPKIYKFVWLWTIFSVILLSLIPEKKSRYLLPVLIPLALNTGFYIEYLRVEFKNIQNKKEKYLIHFSFGIIAIIALIVAFGGIIYFRESIFKNFQNPINKWLIGLLVVGLYCSYTIYIGLRDKLFSKIFNSIIFLMCGVMFFGLPLYPLIQPNELSASAKWLLKFESIYQIKSYESDSFIPEIVLDYGKSIPIIEKKNLSNTLPKENRFGLLVDKKDSTFIPQILKGYTAKHIGFVDLNTTSKKSKSYNPRLYRDYYLIEKQ